MPSANRPPRWHIDGELRILNEESGGSARLEGLASHFDLKESARFGVRGAARRANTLGVSMKSGAVEGEPHRHRAAHLFYVVRGELTCEASDAWWLVPPQSALWIPSSVVHRIRARAPLEGYNVFLDPDVARHMPSECCAVSVTPLLREVIVRLGTRPVDYDVDGPDARLVAVLLDEFNVVTTEKHRLPMPTDPRLQQLVALLTAQPAASANVKTWAKRIGVAERTLNRLLTRETGLSFGRWRQQLHVVLAIQQLSRGASVQSVATDLGYENSSSFVTMFRKAMGTSPRRYMQARRSGAVIAEVRVNGG